MGSYQENTPQLKDVDDELKPYTWLHTAESLPNSWVSIFKLLLHLTHLLALDAGKSYHTKKKLKVIFYVLGFYALSFHVL